MGVQFASTWGCLLVWNRARLFAKPTRGGPFLQVSSNLPESSLDNFALDDEALSDAEHLQQALDRERGVHLV